MALSFRQIRANRALSLLGAEITFIFLKAYYVARSVARSCFQRMSKIFLLAEKILEEEEGEEDSRSHCSSKLTVDNAETVLSWFCQDQDQIRSREGSLIWFNKKELTRTIQSKIASAHESLWLSISFHPFASSFFNSASISRLPQKWEEAVAVAMQILWKLC